MAVTPNYGWPIPVATNYVKDGWDAIADLGNAIDTTVATLGSGLTLVKTQTIGTAVSSVTVTDAFSATYDNYRILVTGGTNSAGTTVDLALQLGATTSGYKYFGHYSLYGGGVGTLNSASASNFTYALITNNNGHTNSMDILQPYLAKYTSVSYIRASDAAVQYGGGILPNTTSYTAFTLISGSGTITGGEIRVYGYQNS